jgi:hypothetical protein
MISALLFCSDTCQWISCVDTDTISYLIRVRVRGYINLLKTYVPQWILDIGYDMGTGKWAKMEYPCNLGDSQSSLRALLTFSVFFDLLLPCLTV